MAQGYDHLRINMDLVLDLPFREGTDIPLFQTLDLAKPHHIFYTNDAAPWLALSNDLMTMDWAAVDLNFVYVQPAAGDLAFTTQDFSGAVWISPHAYDTYLIDVGSDPPAEGWGFYLRAASPYLAFVTRQAGPTLQITQGGPTLALNAWQFVGFTRAGAVAHLYLNGVDVTTVSAVHVDPVDASINSCCIATDVAGVNYYDGGMWRPRIWKRALTAAQMVAMFEMERKFFGV